MASLVRLMIVLAALAGFTGCTTFHSPPKLTSAERAIVHQAGLSHLNVAVSIAGSTAENKNQLAADFANFLGKAGLFKSVQAVSDDSSAPADLIIRVTPHRPGFRCLTGPGSFVVTTLGIIPYNVGYDASVVLEFQSASGHRLLTLAHSDKGSAWWGSLISLLALSPSWTLNRPDEARHVQRIALLVARHRDEILQITKASP